MPSGGVHPFTQQIEVAGAAARITTKLNRRWKLSFSSVLHRDRNAAERMFGRVADFAFKLRNRYDHNIGLLHLFPA